METKEIVVEKFEVAKHSDDVIALKHSEAPKEHIPQDFDTFSPVDTTVFYYVKGQKKELSVQSLKFNSAVDSKGSSGSFSLILNKHATDFINLKEVLNLTFFFKNETGAFIEACLKGTSKVALVTTDISVSDTLLHLNVHFHSDNSLVFSSGFEEVAKKSA